VAAQLAASQEGLSSMELVMPFSLPQRIECSFSFLIVSSLGPCNSHTKHMSKIDRALEGGVVETESLNVVIVSLT
jgi:hypothetical protein